MLDNILGSSRERRNVASHSVSEWIASLKRGESEAVQQLWKRYSAALLKLARDRIGHLPQRAADEDDVAQNVFISLCRGAAAGRFANVVNRDELWWLLVGITKQKTANSPAGNWPKSAEQVECTLRSPSSIP